MTDENKSAKKFARRTMLQHGAGIAAVGAISALATTASTAPAAARTTGAKSTPGTLPSTVAGVRIPDSGLAREAVTYAQKVCSGTIFNHSLRTYLFGALIFDRRGVTYDRELVFVAAVLHDLGLVEAFRTPTERFEVDGADAARRFLTERHVPAERAELVWDAIALHTNVGIATRKRPEIAMISVGSGMDFAGNDLEQLPSDALEDVLTTFPREGFKKNAIDTILSLCRTKPMAELMHPFAEVGRRHIPDFSVPTVEDLVLAAPFTE
ncbi:phosphohydrolase [Streptomyces violaceusniger]|uniref:HD domain-containing protein n=2 Tax=Streptomyces violaceusniger group TaxID=2839105 RepID=A0ABD5JF22_9ACTN|nr:HD domain-containing protein [Streptomyces violaceusniger]KUL61594.1 phosphohydrolase [Streptomyces violaceusniger]MEE4587008.1 HD domain-containing protein [Streptomyces sp. DSM 41602]